MLRPVSSPRWSLTIGLAASSLLIGLSLAVFLSLPQLTGIYPPPGAQNVSSRAPIRFSFTRPMARASVEAAFKLTPSREGQFDWTGDTLTFTPAQPWPAGETVTVSLAGSTGARGLPLRGESTWSFTVSRPRVAYLAGAVPNLWVIPFDSQAQPQQVTAETVGIADYDVSPDGTRFIYAAQRADGGADVRLVNVDGTGASDLIVCPKAACLSPTLSPDAQRVAYQRQALTSSAAGGTMLGASQVHVYTLSTGQDEIMGEAANEARSPRWGPDGRLSYYDVTRQAIVIRDLASGAVTYIPDTSGEMGAWAPDGQSIVFPEVFFPPDAAPDAAVGVGEAPTHFFSRLLRVTISTNAQENLSGADAVDDGSPAFSPSGEWLAFGRKALDTSQWTPGRQIWLMRLGPTGSGSAEVRALTADPLYNQSAFAWNADGSALIYMRFKPAAPEEPAEIWTINTDGSGARLLVTGGYLPEWLP